MTDASHPNPRIAQRLENIYRLHRKAIDMRLERSPYAELLDRLGRPQDRLPPVVHIAGTNGKGSTLAFLRAMLEAGGYTAHVYTSPHLLRFNERVTIAGTEISDDALSAALDRIEAVNEGLPLTFFEYTTALALDVFAQNPADICLLETGMGGRLDCTNVVARPACTAITNIGLDHVQFLGDTLEKIAVEKAGIMKFGVDCVIAPQDHAEAVMPVFREIARKNAVMLHHAAPVEPGVALGLHGVHQRANAGTALAVLDVLKNKRFCFDEDAAARGLGAARWPGRLAPVQDHRRTKLAAQLMMQMPKGTELWYDGGHNPAGARVLADCIREWTAQGHPVLIAFGMQYDKDAAAFLQQIVPYAAGVVLLDVPGGMHPQTATELYDRLPSDVRARCVLGAENAGCFADALSPGTPRVLVCGSLYLYQQIHTAH